MRVTILGCGSSSGAPVIGCECPTCTSQNPKNTRTRVSIHIEINGINLAVDTSPDFRQQMLRENIKKLDAILYTHDHADHTHGIDDIRSFNYMRSDSIPAYGNAQTIESLNHRFAYVFKEKPANNHWFRPSLIGHVLPEAPAYDFEVNGVNITAIQQSHGKMVTLGYRIGKFAYSTDVETLPETAFEALAGVEVWVVDCLRYTPSFSHSYLARTLEWIERVKPKQAILTHMAHDFDYETLMRELPSGVVPAYDGMKIDI